MTPRPPAPALSPDEQATVARFNAAPVPVEGWEQRVEAAAQAIRDSNGTPEALDWWRRNPQLIPAHIYAAAALTADAALAGQNTTDEETDRG